MAVCQWNGYNNNLCNHLYEKLFTLSSIRQLQLDEVCSVDHLICIWVKSTQSQESLWSHMGKLTCVNCRENKVIMSLSLYRLIPVSSSVMVKNEAPYTASCSFFFLIEVSDFPRPHTCVKQMIMLLESFTVTLLRWIWAALSHHANAATQKK